MWCRKPRKMRSGGAGRRRCRAAPLPTPRSRRGADLIALLGDCGIQAFFSSFFLPSLSSAVVVAVVRSPSWRAPSGCSGLGARRREHGESPPPALCLPAGLGRCPRLSSENRDSARVPRRVQKVPLVSVRVHSDPCRNLLQTGRFSRVPWHVAAATTPVQGSASRSRASACKISSSRADHLRFFETALHRDAKRGISGSASLACCCDDEAYDGE